MSGDTKSLETTDHAAAIMCPAISNVKFLQFFEIARAFVRFDHVASAILKEALHCARG
jgi:hypothetical protein